MLQGHVWSRLSPAQQVAHRDRPSVSSAAAAFKAATGTTGLLAQSTSVNRTYGQDPLPDVQSLAPSQPQSKRARTDGLASQQAEPHPGAFTPTLPSSQTPVHESLGSESQTSSLSRASLVPQLDARTPHFLTKPSKSGLTPGHAKVLYSGDQQQLGNARSSLMMRSTLHARSEAQLLRSVSTTWHLHGKRSSMLRFP